MPPVKQFALLAGLLSVVDAFECPIAISSPAKVPADASGYIQHDFASFSFPAHFLPDFCGMLLMSTVLYCLSLGLAHSHSPITSESHGLT